MIATRLTGDCVNTINLSLVFVLSLRAIVALCFCLINVTFMCHCVHRRDSKPSMTDAAAVQDDDHQSRIPDEHRWTSDG